MRKMRFTEIPDAYNNPVPYVRAHAVPCLHSEAELSDQQSSSNYVVCFIRQRRPIFHSGLLLTGTVQICRDTESRADWSALLLCIRKFQVSIISPRAS